MMMMMICLFTQIYYTVIIHPSSSIHFEMTAVYYMLSDSYRLLWCRAWI